MARKKRGEHHEEHIDETWLIPYADLLTLLLALFIVLFASAQVDQKKFEQLAQSFSDAFRGGSSVFESNRTPPQVVPGQPQPPQMSKAPGIQTGIASVDDNYIKESLQLLEVKKVIDQYIKDNGLGGDLSTVLSEDGLMIRIKDTALFNSGSAELLPESQRFGGEIAKLLSVLPQRVFISGHTDTVPINTREFPTNWDLSSKRALNFMKYLMLQEPKLKPQRFSAIGYGEYQPIDTNDTPEGRSKNRRVEVMIIRSYRAQ